MSVDNDAATAGRALKGGFGALLRRKKTDTEDDLPEMDLEGGLSRALRMTGSAVTGSAHGRAGSVDIDHLREALSAIEAALYTIDQTRDIIEEAFEIVLSAQETDDDGGRALLAESYDELRLSIGALIDNVDERAAGLIGKAHRQMDVELGGKAHYSISPFRLDISERGLNLEPPREAFSSEDEIQMIVDALDRALARTDRAANAYCRDAQFLINRMKENTAA